MLLNKYELDNIYNVECVEGIKELSENCIDLVVTSPPYDDLRDYKSIKRLEMLENQLF